MTYIITDSIKSVNRIIRRKNYEGISTFGMETITALGLAWQVVIAKRSEEGLISARLINNNTASALVLELMLKNPKLLSFVPRESVALATAKEILDNMNLLRENTYKMSSDSRVQELLHFIGLYETTLNERGLYDEAVVLSEAIKILEADSSRIPAEEVKTCYYSSPSMLEAKFVSLLNNAGEFEKPENIEATYSFVKAYGISNEVDYVAKNLIENNIPLGDTEIICDGSIYAPFIKECFSKRGLAYNFTSSVSGAGFNFIQILKNLLDWDLNGCKYEDLFNIMNNPLYAFDVDGSYCRASSTFTKGISYGIGWGADRYFDVQRIAYEVDRGIAESDYQKVFREIELKELGILSRKLNKAVSNSNALEAFDALLDYGNSHKFKRSQENKYTSMALLSLRKNIASVDITFADKKEMYEYLKNSLSNITYSQAESYDAANISSIYTPAVVERKCVFVLGLSAKEFKISVADSPVLNDKLRKEIFGLSPVGNVTFAEDALERAEQIVVNMLESAPEGSHITLLSSSADNLRDSSGVSSSALFEKLLAEKNETCTEETQYYEITTYDVDEAHDKAWNGYKPNWPKIDKDEGLHLSLSKSTLDILLACPLRYHYEKELYIDQEEYTEYDPGKWLAVNEAGTLVHRILELYANAKLKDNESVEEVFDPKCKEFVSAVETAASEAEKNNAVPSLVVRDAELRVLSDMAIAYLKYLHKDLHDNGWIVYSCEEDIKSDYSVYNIN